MYSQPTAVLFRAKKVFCLLVVLFSILFTSNLFACKLFMMVSKDKDALSQTEIENMLTGFRAQGPGNPNGWGIVAFDVNGDPIPGSTYIYQANGTYSTTPNALRFSGNRQANLDPKFVDAVNIIKASSPHVIIAHLRQASSGDDDPLLPDPHPFVFKNSANKYYAFAHNGTVPSSVLTTMSTWSNNYAGQTFGTTMTGWFTGDDNIDSSQYFRYILAQLYTNEWKMGKVAENLLNDVNNVFLTGNYITSDWSGNFVMTDGKQGFALRRKSLENSNNPYLLHSNAQDRSLNYFLVMTTKISPDQAGMSEIENDCTADYSYPAFEYYAPGNGYWHYRTNTTNQYQGVNYKMKLFKRDCYFPETLPIGTRDYWSWFSYPLKTYYQKLPGDWRIIRDIEGHEARINSNGTVTNTGIDTVPEAIDGYKASISSSEIVTSSMPNSFINMLPQVETFTLNCGAWVGYWLMNNQTLKDALGSHFNSVQRVYSERWAYDASNMLTANNMYQMMEFGKMYIIELKTGIASIPNFTWNNSLISSTPAPLVQQSSNFSYITQPDYEVLNIESVDSKSGEMEIGVFANNDCIGAVKVNGFPAQILLYTCGYEGYPLSFEVIDGSKNSSKDFIAYEVSPDKAKKKAELYTGDIQFNNIRLMSSGSQEEKSAQVFNLRNYPNPGNPSTTIRFSLNEAQKVSVDIYNIKGQKVKTLVNQHLSQGTHGFVWTGEDDNNHSVSTGVYFYRVSTDT
ncbi:MAG: T9SS type A sorting domain-containing protein, partial [Candidatus Cloacimonetes bacterium]|nr:T9SS type A sorting domain-containing protein [Candidatus Cloacimonadota bacterium]